MESNILMDNATLTSIQRALGFMKTKNDSVFDLELSNLENLCETLLFNDDVFIPHDIYISDFITERKALFSDIGIKNLEINPELLADVEEIASREFSRWYLDYQDDQEGLFNRIMNMMDIYMKFVWNYRSSEYWLVLRAFQSAEKTSEQRIPIFESILGDSNKGIWTPYNKNKHHAILDVYGREMTEDKLQDGYNLMVGPKKMMAAISWNVYRSIYYRIIATLNDLTYSPHSLRGIGAVVDAITANEKCVTGDLLSQYGFPKSSKTITDSLQEIMISQKKELFNVGAISGANTVALPAMLAYVIEKAGSREEFFEVLTELKQHKRLIDLRAGLRGFESAVKSGDNNGIRAWNGELGRVSIAVRKEIGIDDSRLELNPLSYISGGSVNAEGLGIPIPKSLNRIVGRPSSWKLWYREVVLSIRNVARIGNNYEKVKSWATFEDTEGSNWYSKKDYPMKYTQTLDQGIS